MLIKFDSENKKIIFSKKPGYHTRSIPLLELNLISAYICHLCKRIIMCYFFSSEKTPVWKYEDSIDESTYYQTRMRYRKEEESNYFHFRDDNTGLQGFESKQIQVYSDSDYSHSNYCPCQIRERITN